MGFFKSLGNIVKKATKPVKKVLKSPVGKAALLGLGAYYAPSFLGKMGIGGGKAGFGWMKSLGAMKPWKMGAAAGLGSLALSKMAPEEEEEEETIDTGDGQKYYLRARQFFPEFRDDTPLFASQGGRVKAQGGMYTGNMNSQGLGSLNEMAMGQQENPMAQQIDPRAELQEQMNPANRTNAEQGILQLAQNEQNQSETDLIQLIKMLVSMGVPMEQLRGRTREELVELVVQLSGGEGIEKDIVREEEEVVQAAQGGRIGYDIGGAPHSEVVEEQEDIEVAGTDTPILELEDLPKLLEDFYEIFGRSPTSIDELKSWAANRTTEAPEEVVEEQVVEANTGGRIGYDIGGSPHSEAIEQEDNILIKIAKILFGLTPGGMGALGAYEAYKMYQGLNPDTQERVKTMGKQLAQGATMLTAPGMAIGLAKKGYDMYQDRAGDELIEGEEVIKERMNQGGLTRTGYALGQPVIPSKDGMQLDMRETGGYQPHGKAEKHDDVRALLAQGEFVMTSDAVKGMGGGDREVGAKKMYNLMHNMEAMA